MVIFTVLFMSAFTLIQLNNQLNTLTQFSSYRAILSSKIVKDNLEAVLKKSSGQDEKNLLQTALTALFEADIIKSAVIFDNTRTVIAATDRNQAGSTVRYKDLDKINYLQTDQESRWHVSEIDNINRYLDIFVGVSQNPQTPIRYVAKMSFALGNYQEAFLSVFKTIIITSVIIILANILLAYLLSKMVIGPIKILNQVTKLIAAGDLTVRTNIKTEDELEELGTTFNSMTEALVKMKERAENANPLTKLPGNLVIHENVSKRIADNRKFMVIYCDLDNFKSFNDKYGIAKGDDAIKMAADTMKEAIKRFGNPDDFIGHEGGDDFILLTSPEKSQEIANYIMQEFKGKIRTLYSQEDLEQGYIISTGRDGVVKQFPIMTISLAGVTNEQRPIANYQEVTNIAAEMKKKAKLTQGSVFVVDRRKV
jgi:diguanylate cyclase (GGDEF)-like protein